ncbi:MAG: HepT-like ribonuclease domain-containing protein [Catalinimonas sp.]
MRKEEDQVHLNNINDAIQEVHGYVQGMDYNAFVQAEETRMSAVRNLQMIGEAVTLLSPEFKEGFTAIDLEVLSGLRNAGYNAEMEIDPHALWSIINDDLPVIRDQINTASEQLDEEE